MEHARQIVRPHLAQIEAGEGAATVVPEQIVVPGGGFSSRAEVMPSSASKSTPESRWQ